MDIKCKHCGLTITEEIAAECTWGQGRCPHQTSLLNQILSDRYKARFYNLLRFLKIKK